ncbi:MAG: SUF system Fe-S cluster assembly regulator [Alphaproteobacteria bacterium]|nr:SUF system Fe-S cluster assembly regulator [Alphaproteobacteria bacterium]
MIKLSRLACYGVVILSEMASGDKLRTASDISEVTCLPEPTVAKILKLLARDGFVASSRGVHGGYSLQKAPGEISIASIIATLDGPIALTGCVDGMQDDCRLRGICSLQGCWDEINFVIRDALENMKLSAILAKREFGAG